jgi:hypothetical protein
MQSLGGIEEGLKGGARFVRCEPGRLGVKSRQVETLPDRAQTLRARAPP